MRNLEYEYNVWIGLYLAFGDKYAKDMAEKTKKMMEEKSVRVTGTALKADCQART